MVLLKAMILMRENEKKVTKVRVIHSVGHTKEKITFDVTPIAFLMVLAAFLVSLFTGPDWVRHFLAIAIIFMVCCCLESLTGN